MIRVLKDFGLTVLSALILLSDKSASEAVRAVYVRCACVAFPLSLLYTKYYDVGKSFSRGGDYTFSGIATQKNSLGDMVMVFLFFIAWDYLQSRSGHRERLWDRRWWDHLALLLMGALLLFLSQSRTSLAGVAVAFTLLASRNRWAASRAAKTAVSGAAISLPVLLLFTQGFSSVFSPVLNALGRDATLTGRTGIWEKINGSTVNPLIGAGFWNFWSTSNGEALAAAVVGAEEAGFKSAHNGFVDVYLDGGMIGCAVLVVLVLAAARQILRAGSRRGFHDVRFVFLVVALISNLTESFFARPSPLWFTTVLVFLNYPFRDARDGGGGTNGSRATGATADGLLALEEIGTGIDVQDISNRLANNAAATNCRHSKKGRG
jgi:O-antigen ligase